MNLLLLSKDDFIDRATVRLHDRRHKHIVEILKSKTGDVLCVGLKNGKIGDGTITFLNAKRVELKTSLKRKPPKALPLTLILALPRPPVLKRVLLSASSMGIKKIILLQCHKVEKSFWQSSAFKDGSIEEHLVLGLEQARDTVMPEVLLRKRFKPFVEDELPHLMKDTLPLVAHPESKKTCPRRIKKPVTLVIGPEGGLTPYEVDKLQSIGFKTIHLGERILRVETAVPAIVAKLF